MSIAAFVIGSLICILSLSIAIVIVAFILRGFSHFPIRTPSELLDQRRLVTHEKYLRTFEEQMMGKNGVLSIDILRKAFFLDPVYSSIILIEAIGSHNLSVLRKVFMLAEERAIRIPSLQIVEELIIERTEILRSIKEASKKISILEPKLRGRNWASKEFREKIEVLEDKLKTNRQAIESQLREIFLRFPLQLMKN